MIELTEAAIDRLRTVRRKQSLDQVHGVRVGPNDEGKLHLMIDAVRGDDLVIEDEGLPLVGRQSGRRRTARPRHA